MSRQLLDETLPRQMRDGTGRIVDVVAELDLSARALLTEDVGHPMGSESTRGPEAVHEHNPSPFPPGGEVDTHPGLQSLDYLGLQIDLKQWIIRREGREQEVVLTGKKVWWHIFMILAKERGGYCSREMLLKVWENYGTETDPQEGTINDAVSEVRRLLKPLGLKIPNAIRGFGWKLLDEGKPEKQ